MVFDQDLLKLEYAELKLKTMGVVSTIFMNFTILLGNVHLFISVMQCFRITLGAKYFFSRSVAPPCEKAIFAFERSCITSAMRKSMLNVPVPDSF